MEHIFCTPSHTAKQIYVYYLRNAICLIFQVYVCFQRDHNVTINKLLDKSFLILSKTQCHIYILESNPHTFYSFRGLKNQMRIRIECGLDSRSRAGFWKNGRAGVRAVRTIQLFIILFIILYNILKYL
jgi:hypothetical protein